MKICVFCGGVGTRMWPLSRRKKPKQFQPLVGKKSMFQLMIERLRKGFELKDIYVVTGKEYKEVVKKQVPGLPKNNLILEPEMRDTLGAVGFAAAFLEKKYPNEVMAAVWGADHLVKNVEKFIKALKTANKLAREKDVIVKLDVRPTFPSVHLGYVQIGRKIGKESGFEMFEFVKHIEKPNLKRARELLESGNYLWNTGYLVWKISTVMKLYKKHVPKVYRILKKTQVDLGDRQKEREVSSNFAQIPKISIDYALFEKLEKGKQLVLLTDLGWTDIGAWNVLKDELAENEEANVINGQHLGIDTFGCLIYGPDKKKLIATVGLNNMIVVDTKDSLLICPASRAADIKKIVAKLEKEKKGRYL